MSYQDGNLHILKTALGGFWRDETKSQLPASLQTTRHQRDITKKYKILKMHKTPFEGAWLIEPELISDARGAFTQTFCVEGLRSKVST